MSRNDREISFDVATRSQNCNAIAAAESLRAILANGQIANAVRWTARVVEAGRAGRRRVRFDEAPEWWHRLEIVDEDGQRNALRFIFTTDRARAEETLATGQLALADAFIRAASNSPSANAEAARTLYEMLLPLPLKEAAPRQGDLVLLVDECSARYPWELLENRWSDNGRPPAVNAGLVRQLRTADFRPRPAHAFEARALVVVPAPGLAAVRNRIRRSRSSTVDVRFDSLGLAMLRLLLVEPSISLLRGR